MKAKQSEKRDPGRALVVCVECCFLDGRSDVVYRCWVRTRLRLAFI